MTAWKPVCLLASLALFAGACAEAVAPAVPEPAQGQDAELAATLTLGDPWQASLPGGAHNQLALSFRMQGPGRVWLRTQAAEGGEPELDTVLELLRRRAGTWERVAHNDDAPGTRFSELSEHVNAGEYRVVVRGFRRRTQGSFLLTSRCEGAGCPARPPQCLFGTTFRELRDSASFAAPTHERLTAARAGKLTASEAAQVLAAVRVAYEDAADLDAAFASVDEGEVNRYTLRELHGSRTFVAYEYGAGDNSYGAAFLAPSASAAVEIHDGDLYECTIFGVPRGARVGADCGGSWGMTCDFGLRCVDFDPERGAGVCAH